MPTYRLDILITGTDRASPRVSGFGRALGRIGQIAAGILIAGAIRGITDQIAGLARTAFESIADIERMTVGMEGLIARELARGETVETVSTAIRTLTEAEILSLDKLRLGYFLLGEELAEAETHYGDMIGEFGEGSMEVLEASIAVRELKGELAETGTEMENLAAMEGAVVSFTTSSTEGAIGLADALGLAQAPAKQLLDWVVQQALLSPYGEEEVMAALRVAAGYGFITQYGGEAVTETERLALAQEHGVVTAQRITLASLDLIAAIGEQPETLVRIMRALGQIRGHGKLLGMEIRQLVNAGVGLDIMALSMGMTVDEFQRAQKEGKILADEFIPALVKTIEEGLGGSAARLSKTLAGLKENFGDLRRVMLRELFGPLVYAIEPAILRFYETLRTPENIQAMREWGEDFRDSAIDAYDWVVRLWGAVNRTKNLFDNPWEIVLALSPEDWTTKQKRQIVDGIMEIGDAIDRIQELDPPGENLGFEEPENVLGGALTGLSIVGGVGLLVKVGGVIIGLLGAWAAAIGVVGFAAAGLGALWYGNFLGIRDITADAWEYWIKPAFFGISNWFTETAKPAMITFHDEWKEKVLQAWEDAKDYIDNDLIPALIRTRRELEDKWVVASGTFKKHFLRDVAAPLKGLHTDLIEDVIPAVKDFALKLGTDVYDAAVIVSGPLRNVLGTWESMGRTLIQDTLPAIWEFIRVVGGDLVTSGDTARRVVGVGLLGAFSRLGEETKEHLMPALSNLSSNLLGLGTWVTGLVRHAFEEWLLPAFTKVGNFLAFHVAPVLGAVLRLFGAIAGVIWLLLIGALYGLFGILEKIWSLLAPGFIRSLQQVWDFMKKIGGAMWWIVSTVAKRFIDEFLREVETIAGNVAGILDWLAESINNVAGAMNDWTNTQIPELWEPHSIPPIAQGFLDTAMALDNLEESYQRSSMFKVGAYGGISSPMLAGAGVGAGSVQVNVEGDTNHFVVTSEKLAEYVAHQLREEKVKRYNHYMGR